VLNVGYGWIKDEGRDVAEEGGKERRIILKCI
jgi:hypothetical protein